jgi:hypothetical protein
LTNDERRVTSDELLMSRIAQTFASLKACGPSGLVTYITAGDPSLARTRDLAVRAGAGWRRRHRAGSARFRIRWPMDR